MVGLKARDTISESTLINSVISDIKHENQREVLLNRNIRTELKSYSNAVNLIKGLSPNFASNIKRI